MKCNYYSGCVGTLVHYVKFSHKPPTEADQFFTLYLCELHLIQWMNRRDECKIDISAADENIETHRICNLFMVHI